MELVPYQLDLVVDFLCRFLVLAQIHLVLYWALALGHVNAVLVSGLAWVEPPHEGHFGFFACVLPLCLDSSDEVSVRTLLGCFDHLGLFLEIVGCIVALVIDQSSWLLQCVFLPTIYQFLKQHDS